MGWEWEERMMSISHNQSPPSLAHFSFNSSSRLPLSYICSSVDTCTYNTCTILRNWAHPFTSWLFSWIYIFTRYREWYSTVQSPYGGLSHPHHKTPIVSFLPHSLFVWTKLNSVRLLLFLLAAVLLLVVVILFTARLHSPAVGQPTYKYIPSSYMYFGYRGLALFHNYD